MKSGKSTGKKAPAKQKAKNHNQQIKQNQGNSGGTSMESTEVILSSLGNSTISRLAESGVLQTKLNINVPGDMFERQADKAAEQVMKSGPNNTLSPKLDTIQAKGNKAGGKVSGETEAGIKNLKGKGSPLNRSTRDYFEPRYGKDLGNVRVHTGNNANKLANDVNARAFTHGNDVVFNKGEYQPESKEGKKLIAHELAHTIQQGGGSSPTSIHRKEMGPPKPPKEGEGKKKEPDPKEKQDDAKKQKEIENVKKENEGRKKEIVAKALQGFGEYLSDQLRKDGKIPGTEVGYRALMQDVEGSVQKVVNTYIGEHFMPQYEKAVNVMPSSWSDKEKAAAFSFGVVPVAGVSIFGAHKLINDKNLFVDKDVLDFNLGLKGFSVSKEFRIAPLEAVGTFETGVSLSTDVFAGLNFALPNNMIINLDLTLGGEKKSLDFKLKWNF